MVKERNRDSVVVSEQGSKRLRERDRGWQTQNVNNRGREGEKALKRGRGDKNRRVRYTTCMYMCAYLLFTFCIISSGACVY